jgi:hypothetical protein
MLQNVRNFGCNMGFSFFYLWTTTPKNLAAVGEELGARFH